MEVPSANPAWPARRASSDRVPVEVVSLPSKGEGRTPGAAAFSLSTLPPAESLDCASTTFLFLKAILEHLANMFDVNQWSSVTFFEPAIVKDFSETCSLAATASESDQSDYHKDYSLRNLDFIADVQSKHTYDSNHYSPGTSSQKRQKIFDYAEENYPTAIKESPTLQYLQSPAALQFSLGQPVAQ
jgi:hypothetical protein